jgi:hypothetical protein
VMRPAGTGCPSMSMIRTAAAGRSADLAVVPWLVRTRQRGTLLSITIQCWTPFVADQRIETAACSAVSMPAEVEHVS